ncbi:hypothetical protein K469DRAFT_691369 [Zopfia rhizophila CBS 207.26]|uniref:Uncharacterized protein n=1 Tax=Zopfia rhizophila CBS 207.26 TaxID=1314779 RepID=A0A6A6DVW9_9PEZI|nr:hypothetical protein K469DRAFT_691369 [Zopfia rhizophila CBS 207.26]
MSQHLKVSRLIAESLTSMTTLTAIIQLGNLSSRASTGSQPGVTPTGAEEAARNLPQYRHGRSNEEDSRLDGWVVMHLHVNLSNHPQLFTQINGRMYIGFDSIQVFHAQGWSQLTILSSSGIPLGPTPTNIASFRADGNDQTFNARQAFYCETDANSVNGVIYLGRPITDTSDPFWQAFDIWAQRLHRLGYTGTLDILPFRSQPSLLQNGELDPQNPGSWQPPLSGSAPGGTSPEFNNYNPYSVSFTLSDLERTTSIRHFHRANLVSDQAHGWNRGADNEVWIIV